MTTIGLTYLELGVLFEKRAKAKKFKAIQVNLANSGYFSISEPDDASNRWRGYG
jgi:SP family general alpha glucoside:H+ symporter-like MFS transporter